MNGGDSATKRRALEDLCQLYWNPVFAFIQAQGHSEHDAEDLTQGFFEHFLAREDFGKTDESRGKLRNYLLISVKHYLTDQYRKNGAEKRGGKAVHVSIDQTTDDVGESRPVPLLEPVDPNVDPDKVFRQKWATSMLESVLQQLEARYVEEDQALLFDALRPFVSLDDDTERQAEIAERFGLSPGALRTRIHRMRQAYGKLLREAIAETLGPDEDIDAELRELLKAFA